MLFDMSLIKSSRKLNKLLSRAENKLLVQLIGGSCECLTNGIVHIMPGSNSTNEAAGYSSPTASNTRQLVDISDDSGNYYENQNAVCSIKPGHGVICLLKDRTFEAAYQIKYFTLVQGRSLWNTFLDWDCQVQRPRPDLVIFITRDSSILLRFVLTDEANTFFTMTQLAINDVKRRTATIANDPTGVAVEVAASPTRKLTKLDISLPTDFRNLDLTEWNCIRGDRAELKPVKQSRVGKLKPILMKKHQNVNAAGSSKSFKLMPSASANEMQSSRSSSFGDLNRGNADQGTAVLHQNGHKKLTLMDSLKKIVHIKPNAIKPKCSLPSFKSPGTSAVTGRSSEGTGGFVCGSLLARGNKKNGYETFDDDEAPLLT